MMKNFRMTIFMQTADGFEAFSDESSYFGDGNS